MQLSVKKGKILVYRVFDIAEEINISKVKALFSTDIQEKFRLDRKYNSSLIISQTPISLFLGKTNLSLLGKSYEAILICKVWPFGTASLCFQLTIDNHSWDELIDLSCALDTSVEIDEVAISKIKEFQLHIQDAIKIPNEWDTFEDYVTFFIEELSDSQLKPSELPLKVDVTQLLLAEKKNNLSFKLRSKVLDNSFQYFDDDMVIVDWNSALVIEPSGSMDVPLIIEFALNQLLEMRYYDDLLDQKLNQLYGSVAGKKKGMFSNEYSKLAEEAGQIYIDISEIIENVENSFKTVGDFYLATIFRETSKRFRFDDWTKSINEKLNNLAEISKLFHSEVNASRSHSLEIIIIILIAIEVVPFVYNLINK